MNRRLTEIRAGSTHPGATRQGTAHQGTARRAPARHLAIMLVLLLVVVAPGLAQEVIPARGPVIEGNIHTEIVDTLNPLVCRNSACRRLTDLLYPRLIAVDPATGLPTVGVPGTPTASGLAARWDISADGTVYTVTLRNDLTWSDGSPITAYDVFFSYAAIRDEQMRSPYREQVERRIPAALPLDATTIQFQMRDAACDAPTWLTFPVIPAAPYAVGFPEGAFRAFLDATFAGLPDVAAAWEVWTAALPEDFTLSYIRFTDESLNPTLTTGLWRFEPGTYREVRQYRLRAADSSVTPEAYALAQAFTPDEVVDRFINGELNFIADPPVDRRADLRTIPGVQVTTLPGSSTDYLIFNTTSAARPRAWDHPEGQVAHPLFSDPAVLQAIRLGLDVDALIEMAVQGDGQRAALNTTAYDPRAAERILYDAGWKDTNGDGLRECVDCTTARPGTSLAFTLRYASNQPRHAINATVIQRQLARIGFIVELMPDNDRSSLLDQLQSQRYDAVLDVWTGRYPYIDAPDFDRYFVEQEDVPDEGLNVTSYVNPDLADALHEVLYLPGCDRATRESLFATQAAVLETAIPYVWLYTPDAFYAAAPGVQGFAPLPDAPLWNLAGWSVRR